MRDGDVYLETKKQLKHLLVEFHTVASKLLEDPAGERWGFVVDEDAAVSNARFAIARAHGLDIDLWVTLWGHICPPVPSARSQHTSLRA